MKDDPEAHRRRMLRHALVLRMRALVDEIRALDEADGARPDEDREAAWAAFGRLVYDQAP